MFAQEAQTLAATVTRTKHNVAVAADQVTEGSFYFEQPDKMCLIFNEDTEKLLMRGSDFIIVNNEKSSVAKGKEAAHLAFLQKILVSILSGKQNDIDTHETADMKIAREDNVIHITPVVTGAKAKRRLMFTAFTLTIDPKTSELTGMCMYERGENYTRYDFAHFAWGEPVDDTVFQR